MICLLCLEGLSKLLFLPSGGRRLMWSGLKIIVQVKLLHLEAVKTRSNTHQELQSP